VVGVIVGEGLLLHKATSPRALPPPAPSRWSFSPRWVGLTTSHRVIQTPLSILFYMDHHL
jgi:hypothetical protein